METGLDRLASDAALQRRIAGCRVGLLSHPASVTRDLVHATDVLAGLGAVPRVAFGPEHGFGGEAQDMVGVADERDLRGTPVRSLYGERFEDLSPAPADLAAIDVLVIDLQDVGARYYTFVWTALLAVRACVRAGVRVLILDRPNPIGGDDSAIEGRLPSLPYLSFVGLEPLPVRHGLTLGEIVAHFSDADGAPEEALTVVAVRGLPREAHAPSWDRPFVMPSPNMPTYETALVYPGGCLVEGTNLSEGRGTTRPFELVGAPWLDGRRLAAEVGALALPGVRFRAVAFQPTFHKHAGRRCGGVQVHVTDPRAFRPYTTYLALLAAARRLAPGEFRFREEAYEFRDDVPAIDLLTGSGAVRAAVGDETLGYEALLDLAAPTATERAVVREVRRRFRGAC